MAAESPPADAPAFAAPRAPALDEGQLLVLRGGLGAAARRFVPDDLAAVGRRFLEILKRPSSRRFLLGCERRGDICRQGSS